MQAAPAPSQQTLGPSPLSNNFTDRELEHKKKPARTKSGRNYYKHPKRIRRGCYPTSLNNRPALGEEHARTTLHNLIASAFTGPAGSRGGTTWPFASAFTGPAGSRGGTTWPPSISGPRKCLPRFGCFARTLAQTGSGDVGTREAQP